MQNNKISLRSVAMAAAIGAALVAQAQTWNNAPNGNWSNGANWLGGVPVAGADLTFFRVGGISSITASNDLGNPFAVRSITFNSLAGTGQSLGVNNVVGNNIVFTGSNPFMTMTGTGFGFFGGTAQLDGPLAVSNSSVGGLQLGANILSNGTNPGSLVFSGTPATFNGSAMILGNTLAGTQSTFTGGATLNSGNLVLIGAAAPTVSTPFGTGALTINGGTVRTGSAITLGNQIVANSDFVYSGSTVLTLNANSSLSGQGGLRIRSFGGGMTIQSASTLNGNVQIDMPPVAASSATAGTLTLDGANGQMQNVQSFTVRDGGSFILANNGTGVLNTSRINANATVNLRGGEFRTNGQLGTTGSAFTQNFGTLNLEGGANAIAVSLTSGTPNVTVAAQNATRNDRATLVVRASNLGSTATTGVGRVALPGFVGSLVGGGGIAGTQNVSILPFAVGDTSVSGGGSGFITMDGGGNVRLLTLSEYQSNSFAGTDRNITIGTATAAAGETVNAVRITSGGITGGTLNVTSGLVLNQTTTASSGSFAFGGNEGVLYTTSALNHTGVLTGTNGVTKAGTANYNARGDNSGLTGTLTINQGFVNFVNPNSIPGTGTINSSHAFGATNTSTSGGSGLQYDLSATGPVTVSRDVNVKKGMFQLNNGATGFDFTMAGNISGDGGLTINGSFGSHAGFMKLTGNNTFTGGIKHWGSNLEISSDANLGNGGAMDLNVGTTAGLRLAGNWTTNRNINQSGSYLMNTNGFNAQWNGRFTSNSATGQWFSASTFVKTGAGDLQITNDSSANSAISVRGDTSTGVGTTTGGSLTIMGIAPGLNITLGGTAGGGKLRGNGTVGTLTYAANGNGVVAPGTSVGTLTATTVSMVNLAKYEYELGNPLASDLLQVRATFNTASPTDVINYDMYALSGIAVGNVYTLATFASTNTLLNQFTSAWPTDPGFAGVFEWDNPTSPTALRYRITAVPEPGTMLALGLGLAALARRRRAKKSS